MENLMTKCSFCGIDIKTNPLKPVLGANLGHLNSFTCSIQCETDKREQMQREGNEKLFRRILKVLPKKYIGVKASDFGRMELRHSLSYPKNQTKADGYSVLQYFCNNDQWCLALASEQTGNGKTRLALYMLACLALKGIFKTSQVETIEDAGYYSAIQISKMIKSESYNSNQTHLRNFCRAKVLLIDDLGQEEKFSNIDIAGILKYREENNLKTIITTNKTPQELESMYSDRINSRVAYGFYQVIGGDFRRRGFE